MQDVMRLHGIPIQRLWQAMQGLQLDAFTKQQVMLYMVDELQCTMLLVTHDTDMAYAVAVPMLVWGQDVRVG